MRILFISEFFPLDPVRDVIGVYQRQQMFIDALKSLGHLEMVFYLPSHPGISEREHAEFEKQLSHRWQADLSLVFVRLSHGLRRLLKIDAAEMYVRSLLAGTYSFSSQKVSVQSSSIPALRSVERCLERKPAFVFAHRLGAMAPLILTKRPLPPVFLDLDDVEHIKFRRFTEQAGNWLADVRYRLQVQALLRAERRATGLARSVFVCSGRDRDALAQNLGAANAVAIPNAVTIPELQPLPALPNLLFLGTYHYRPNVEAAEFLIGEVWPLVRQAVPGARLRIAGDKPENIPSFRAAVPGVEFPGFVKNLDALYRDTRVACCPVQSGSGTRIKIIEAAAHGRPVVATKIGAEGLQFATGKEITLREDALSFAAACVELLRDDRLCQELGAAARQAARERYDRTRVTASIREHIVGALSFESSNPGASADSK